MRWKFLFRPSWLALTAVVFTFAVICFTLLAPWQFGRDADRKAQNAALQASFSAQPKALASLLAPGVAPDERTQWDRITVTGSYVPEGEVIARLRTVQGEPAFEVLTPFRTVEGQTLLVDRGYVRPNDQARVPAFAAPPGGQVTLVTRVRMDENDPKNRDAFADESTAGRLHSYSVDSKVVARSSGLPIRPGYFQLDNDQPGGLGALPLPQLEAGPFFSYALQWIAFGTMAILGWLYFTVREIKPGGALAAERPPPDRSGAPKPQRRKSVAQLLAEDEERERRGERGGDAGLSPRGALSQ